MTSLLTPPCFTVCTLNTRILNGFLLILHSVSCPVLNCQCSSLVLCSMFCYIFSLSPAIQCGLLASFILLHYFPIFFVLLFSYLVCSALLLYSALLCIVQCMKQLLCYLLFSTCYALLNYYLNNVLCYVLFCSDLVVSPAIL